MGRQNSNHITWFFILVLGIVFLAVSVRPILSFVQSLDTSDTATLLGAILSGILALSAALVAVQFDRHLRSAHAVKVAANLVRVRLLHDFMIVSHVRGDLSTKLLSANSESRIFRSSRLRTWESQLSLTNDWSIAAEFRDANTIGKIVDVVMNIQGYFVMASGFATDQPLGSIGNQEHLKMCSAQLDEQYEKIKLVILKLDEQLVAIAGELDGQLDLDKPIEHESS